MTRCVEASTLTAATDPSPTPAVIGAIAESTVISADAPTPMVSAAGATMMGGGVGLGCAGGLSVGAAVEAAVGATLGMALGLGLGAGDGVCPYAPAQSAARARAEPIPLRNLRFGMPNGRGQQRLVTDAGKQHGYQVAFRTLDGAHAEL